MADYHDKDWKVVVSRKLRLWGLKAHTWWDNHGEKVLGKALKKYGAKQYAIMITTLSVLLWYAFSHDILYFFSLLAEIMRLSGVLLLLLRIVKKTQSVQGLSLKTQQLYAGVFLTRLMFKVFYDHDFLYSAVEGACTAVTIFIVYLMRGPYQSTYKETSDNFKELYIVVPCLLLACVLHPNVSRMWAINVLWTFSTYLESVCLLPQLFVFHSASRTVDNMTSLWIVSLFLSRVLEAAFWVFALLIKGNAKQWGSIVWYVVITEIIHTILLLDFVRNFYKCYKQGMSMLLPSAWGFPGKDIDVLGFGVPMPGSPYPPGRDGSPAPTQKASWRRD